MLETAVVRTKPKYIQYIITTADNNKKVLQKQS